MVRFVLDSCVRSIFSDVVSFQVRMSAVGDERSDKRMELERKKQKLAEMREARRRADEEKKRLLLASVPTENGQ